MRRVTGLLSILMLVVPGCGKDKEIIVTLPGGSEIEMVWIEPGTFTMGSSDSEPGRNKYEGPQHEVTITRGFYLGKYEITQEQWESVMAGMATNSYFPKAMISWDDVQAFIAALNAAEGSDLYRLPTEAEWEYACRAGTTTRWSSGDDEGQVVDYAWGGDNLWKEEEKYAHEVGTKLPNPWGLYDMHGNVEEWVQDGHGAYTSDAQTDPTGGPPTRSYRVIRGGSFAYGALSVRSAKRGGVKSGDRGSNIGARLLRQEP